MTEKQKRRNHKSVNYAAFMDESEDEDFTGFAPQSKNKSSQDNNAQSLSKSPKQSKKRSKEMSYSPEISARTSTQEMKSGRKAPAKRFSMEEKLFQRELEAALQMSKLEGGVNCENLSDDEFKSDSFSRPVSQTPPSSSENRGKPSASSKARSLEISSAVRKTPKVKESESLESETTGNGNSRCRTSGNYSEKELFGVIMNGEEPLPSTSWGWTGKRQRKKVSFAEVDSYDWEDKTYDSASEGSDTSSPRKKKKKETRKGKKSPKKSKTSEEFTVEKEEDVEGKLLKSSKNPNEITQDKEKVPEEKSSVTLKPTEESENVFSMSKGTKSADESLQSGTSSKSCYSDNSSEASPQKLPSVVSVQEDETPEKTTVMTGRRKKKAVIIEDDSDDWDEESDDPVSSEESDFAPSPKKKTRGKKEQIKKETKVTKAAVKEPTKGKAKKVEGKSASPKQSTVKTTKPDTSLGPSSSDSKATILGPKRILQKENTVPKSTKGVLGSSRSSVGTKSSESTTSSPSTGRIPVGLVKTPFRSPLLNNPNKGATSPISSRTTLGLGGGIGLRLGLSRKAGGKPLHPSLILK